MLNARGRMLTRTGWLGVTLIALGLTACTASGTGLAFANGSARVSWTAPTGTATGAPLTNLAGYNIYYGRSLSALICRVRIADVHATHELIGGLSGGRWYFVVTAETTSGAQSVPSNLVSKVIPGPLQPAAISGRKRCVACGSC